MIAYQVDAEEAKSSKVVRRARLISSSMESRKLEIMFASGVVVMMIGGAGG